MRLEALLGFTAVESTTEKEAINYVHTWGISTHCLNLPDYEENHQIALRWNKSHQKKSTSSQVSLAVMPTCCEADREGVQLGRRVQGNQVRRKLGWNSPPFCFFIIQKNTSRARSLPAMTHVHYIKRPPTKRVGREGGVGIATTWKKNNQRAAEALGSHGCHGFGVQEQSLGWDQHLPAAPGAWARGQNCFSPVPPVHCRLGREHLLHKWFLGVSHLVLCFVFFSFKKKK